MDELVNFCCAPDIVAVMLGSARDRVFRSQSCAPLHQSGLLWRVHRGRREYWRVSRGLWSDDARSFSGPDSGSGDHDDNPRLDLSLQPSFCRNSKRTRWSRDGDLGASRLGRKQPPPSSQSGNSRRLVSMDTIDPPPSLRLTGNASPMKSTRLSTQGAWPVAIAVTVSFRCGKMPTFAPSQSVGLRL